MLMKRAEETNSRQDAKKLINQPTELRERIAKGRYTIYNKAA